MQRLRDMIREAAKEAGYPTEYLTDDYVDKLIYEYDTSTDKLLIWNDTGFIAGFVTDQYMFLPGVKVALEVAWWVDPQHRNKLIGGRLYKEFEDWAKAHKCKIILQGAYTKGCTELNRMYLRWV